MSRVGPYRATSNFGQRQDERFARAPERRPPAQLPKASWQVCLRPRNGPPAQRGNDTPASDCGFTSQHDLAWALAQAVELRLTPAERTAMYATLGAGEFYPTVTVLLRTALRRQIGLPVELIDDAQRWLRGYAGTDEETEMRDLIDGLRALIPWHSPSIAQIATRSPTVAAPAVMQRGPARIVTQK
jgi:hypothetical protein